MKKTLIASAIAAATFSGSALAQMEASASELAARMDSMPTVYGNIQYAITHTDFENGGSEVSHFDNGSTIGIKHDHEVAPGITAFLKLELEGISADNKAGNKNNTAEIDSAGNVTRSDDSGGLNELDEAYIGIKGDSFGQIWVGSDDSQYEQLIGGVVEYYEVAGLNTGLDYTTGEGDLIQYVSPSFSGFTFHGAVAFQGDGDPQYDEKAYPYQLGAKYSADMLTIAVAMDSNDADSTSSENTYGVNVSADVTNELTVGALYSMRGSKEVGGLAITEGQKNAQIYARYSLGANGFAASYEMSEADAGDDEATVLTLQALHNVSDNLYVYTEGYLRNDDNGTTDEDTTQLAVGAVYYF
ncbi:porin [Marinobacter vulgaris]|uniref:Porin n=1 Tax=Marinobacter vulgaris TaxID=1928331 RepID=A0A2V3ZK56_9GAMM|nr:porin [Marinobacter vulgaris]PXX89303.1 porin [Marinobacter vulgaris]TSJ68134.1 porin [Marinobacter vulgaris]